MKITIVENKTALHRLLVLAPQHIDIDALANEGELVEFQHNPEVATAIAIDALIGEVTEQEFSDTLQEGDYSVLLLVTHGNEQSIVLSGHLINDEHLARLLTLHNIQLLIAMSCTSDKLAQRMLDAGVPYVIGVVNWYDTSGVVHKLDNKIARKYTREFFREYVRANSIERAHEYARSRLPAREADTIILHARVIQPSPFQAIYDRLDAIEIALKDCRKAVDAMDRARSKQISNLAAAIFQLAGAMTRPSDSEQVDR